MRTWNLDSVATCCPPVWARSAHAQTILGHILSSKNQIRIPCTSDRVALPDQSQLAVEWVRGTQPILVVLFHGLSGSSQSDYMQETARLLIQRSYSVLLANHRNCGPGEGLARGPYHSGRGEDIGAVLRWARNRFPSLKQVAVGFSLSGNALLNLLSGNRGDPNDAPDFALTVNAPIDLKATSLHLQTGFNRLYDLRFVWRLKKKLPADIRSAVRWLDKLQDIDRLYTAPAGGFEDEWDYYRRCSTVNHLHKIKTPTLLLSSRNDPFVPVSAYLSANLGAGIQLRIEDWGGHMGYMTQSTKSAGLTPWLPQAITQWIQGLSL